MSSARAGRSRCSRRWLLLAALVAGCTFCDGKAELELARSGDLRGIQEIGDVGDPRIPSSASLTDTRIDEAIAAIASFIASPDPLVRLQTLESARLLATRARDVYRNHFPTLFDGPLADPEEELRWRAAWALGRLERTSEALRIASADPSPRVAERAVWALGQARDEDAIEPLLVALDREPAVAAQAARSLGRITGLRHGAQLDAWRAWGEQRRARREAEARQDEAPTDTDAPVGAGD